MFTWILSIGRVIDAASNSSAFFIWDSNLEYDFSIEDKGSLASELEFSNNVAIAVEIKKGFYGFVELKTN